MLSSDKVSIDSLLPGQSADSDILDVTVISNNPYGYKLTGTVGSTDYTADALYNTADTSKTFSNIGFGVNKSTLGDFDNDTWGYSYSTDGGTTWLGYNGTTGYTGLPLYSGSNTATFLDTDDISAADGDTMQFKIGAKASSSKASGEYNNTINFVATGYSFPLYTVTYNANGGTVSPVSEQVRGTSVTLPTPTNGTKIFGGWCDGAVASSACSGTTYQAGASYTPTSNITFTAMWINPTVTFDDAFANAGKSKYNGYYQMHEMTTAICTAVDEGETGTLIDRRDGTTYTVGKLADDRCWMLDNLALGTTSTIVLDQTYSNTNSSGYVLPQSGTWTSSSQNSSTVGYINAAYKNTIPTDGVSIAGGYKVGVYYNYCAATAGTICSTTTIDASYDICPKGWKLPSGNTNGDFGALANIIYGSFNATYDTTSITNYRLALHLPIAGRFYSGSVDQSNRGAWWSTTSYSNTLRYTLYVAESNLRPADIDAPYCGFSIRCIAK